MFTIKNVTMNQGLDGSLTINEVKEILIHIYAYDGFSRSLNGINAFMSVPDDRKARGITDKSGRGLVQFDGMPVQKMTPGDVVWISANVRHWHGAAPGSPVSHIAISESWDDSAVKWIEHVTDEQYNK